jgi:ribosome-associated toxin RatA of RatAB toxin-antitoxin module
MTTIQAVTIINAPIDRVWELVSDIDNEPKFWKGTKQIRNISREGNTVKREVTIAFKDSKCMQTVTLYPKEKIVGQFTEGILNGSKTVFISQQDGKTKVEAVWDIKLSGMMGLFTGMIKKHIKNGTEQALESIKQELEK